MPYVSRDDLGRITGVFDTQEMEDLEEVGNDDPELAQFLAEQEQSTPDALRQILHESDLGMVRLVDDLVDLLITKGVIRFTDLPPVAGEKYLQRQAARERLKGEKSFIIDEKDII